MFAPVPADTVLPSEIPEGYSFRKYDRKTKKNWGGIAAVTFYCLSLVLYFFVRVTKTMDLGRYMFYGVVVFLIEVRFFFFFPLFLEFFFSLLVRNKNLAPLLSLLSLVCSLTLLLSPFFFPSSAQLRPSTDVRSDHHPHLRRQPGAGPGLRGAGEG